MWIAFVVLCCVALCCVVFGGGPQPNSIPVCYHFHFFLILALCHSMILPSVLRGPYFKPELNHQRSLTTTSTLQCLRLQMTSFSAPVIALIAAEVLLSTVGEHVPLEVTSNCAGITALVTDEGLL